MSVCRMHACMNKYDFFAFKFLAIFISRVEKFAPRNNRVYYGRANYPGLRGSGGT